jgi:hypothetical protein
VAQKTFSAGVELCLNSLLNFVFTKTIRLLPYPSSKEEG